jgi:hypothetical protein
MESGRSHSWEASATRGFSDCPRCRKQPGCGVQGSLQTKSLSHRGQHPVTPHHPRPSESIQQCRPASTTTKSNSTKAVTNILPAARQRAQQLPSVRIRAHWGYRPRQFLFCNALLRVHQDTPTGMHKMLPNGLQHSIPHPVTIVFEDQKNGKKMDAQTQRRSGPPVLCPVLRWDSAVSHIIAMIPKWTDQTTLCSVTLDAQVLEISNAFIRNLLRHTCLLFGGLLHSDFTLMRLAITPFVREPQCPYSSWTSTHQQK